MIKVRNLVKDYSVSKRVPGGRSALAGLFRRRREPLRALDGISFDIEAGELVGFIGPNGAGKSTTIKILSGILVPTSGQVEVEGRVPWKDRAAHVARLGVVFGQRCQLWWDLPVRESLDLLAAIYRVPRATHRANLDWLVGALDVGDLLDLPVRQLSLGQRMRCELVAALQHSPPLLFLDEPTIGLDATSKLALRALVARLNAERGTTVILTTHDMDDIEALARRVILIGGGRILFGGTMAELRRAGREERRVTVDFSGDVGPEALSRAQAGLALAGARLAEGGTRRAVFAFEPAEARTADILSKIGTFLPVADLTVESEPIELLIARLYGEVAPDGGGTP